MQQWDQYYFIANKALYVCYSITSKKYIYKSWDTVYSSYSCSIIFVGQLARIDPLTVDIDWTRQIIYGGLKVFHTLIAGDVPRIPNSVPAKKYHMLTYGTETRGLKADNLQSLHEKTERMLVRWIMDRCVECCWRIESAVWICTIYHVYWN